MTDPVHSHVQITQLFEDKRPVLAPQLNGQARAGLPPADQHALATESPHRGRQGSATSAKPKAVSVSPEQAMKQFMSKLSTFEHHEVFNYPEGEFLPRPPPRALPPAPPNLCCLLSLLCGSQRQEEGGDHGRGQQRRLRR